MQPSRMSSQPPGQSFTPTYRTHPYTSKKTPPRIERAGVPRPRLSFRKEEKRNAYRFTIPPFRIHCLTPALRQPHAYPITSQKKPKKQPPDPNRPKTPSSSPKAPNQPFPRIKRAGDADPGSLFKGGEEKRLPIYNTPNPHPLLDACPTPTPWLPHNSDNFDQVQTPGSPETRPSH